MITLYNEEDVDNQYANDTGHDVTEEGFDADHWQLLCDMMWEDCECELTNLIKKGAIIPLDREKWGYYEFVDLLYLIEKPRDLFWRDGEIKSVTIEGKKLTVGQHSGNAMFNSYEDYCVIDREVLIDLLESLDELNDDLYYPENLDNDKAALTKEIREVQDKIEKLTGQRDLLKRQMDGTLDDKSVHDIVKIVIEKNALDIQKLL